jgi:uncharacterized RDD family membrane protein YckC
MNTQYKFAGFWLRFIALVIDNIIIALAIFPFAFLLGLISPNIIKVEVPFNLFTTSEVLAETEKIVRKDPEEPATVITTQRMTEDVLGLFEYHYKKIIEKTGEMKTSRTVMVDPETQLPIERTSSSDIEFIALFFYWILMEASIYQGSIGKLALGLKVVNSEGKRLTLPQAISRNLLKILSGIILFIGFMMAGWTAKKQALHDKISDMLVVKK